MALDLPPSLDVLQLKKPQGGDVPKQRLSSPDKASAIVSTLIYANQERARVDAMVKGMLDGNAPYSWAELKRQGQTYRTNVNFREGEAMMTDAVTPFYDLFAESDTYAKIEVDERDSDKRTEWSRIVTEEFDALLKEWEGFDWNIQAVLYDFVAYGKGYPFWSDKTSWQFRAIRQSRVLVPDQASSDIDKLELLVLRETPTVDQLYKPIRDEKRAASIGWKVRNVMDACWNAMPKDAFGETPFNYELLQQELRNHDLYQTCRSSVVKIAHIFVKEFDGRVTHLIIEEQDGGRPAAVGRTSVPEPNRVFLYKKVGRFDSFRQVLSPLFYDIGDGTWHSIKGLAIKLYPFIEIKNRLNCSVVDNAFMNMSVLVKALTANGYNGQAIMQLGPLSVLPPNVEVQNWGLAGRMEEGLAVERSLTAKLESNLGQYRKPLLEKQGNPVTATQVTYDAAKEAALGKGAVNRFYAQLDMMYGEIYRRAANPNLNEDQGQNSCALEFQRRCVERGVPKAKVMKPRFIRATRNMGNGSIFLRQQTVLQTAQLVPMMNEGGRQAWLDDAIAVMAGTEAVPRWNPRVELPVRLSDEQAWAVLENAALKEGSPVVWTASQNNAVHASTHLKAAVDAVNSLNPANNGGMANPAEVLAFLDAAGPHIAVHLEQLSRDPTQGQLFKALETQFKQLGRITDQIRQQTQQQMAAQQRQQQQMAQRQQQMMTNGRLDEIELQNKLRMQQQKTDAMLEMKEEKHRQQLALADSSTASDITRKNAVAVTDAARKGAEPDSE